MWKTGARLCLGLATLSLLVLSACTNERTFVIQPEQVSSQNDPDWQIESYPGEKEETSESAR
ncbi:MAG: hypothetical protein NPIRA04_36150 [Nitrospirales bacterium]|nr:MAG: hypothetical protein NPIRA04_36150 [Nitrospirales bacterium]